MSRKNNPFIKTANEQHEYTSAQVIELKKCMEDVVYFVKTYCKIQHPVRGEIPFELYPYQENMLRTFAGERLSIVLASRQVGKSQVSGAFLLWYASFYDDKTILIASNKNDNAKEMIFRIRFMYERLPHWLKPGVTADGLNKHSFGFDNGSRIYSTATSENSGRGLSISLLFCDEFAFVRDSVQQEFWTSMAPTLATGGSCIICSTPNGDSDLFAQLWRGAQLEVNGFEAIEVKWDEPPARDQKFRDQETAKIGEIKFRQEYLCEFLSSDPLLIDAIVLANLTNTVKNIKPVGTINEIVFFSEPQQNSTYLVGMDIATGNGNDFTTLEVFEFPSMIQLAEWRSNKTSTSQSYRLLVKLLNVLERTKSTVYFSIENNGVGESITALYESDENPPDAEFVSGEGTRPGFTTTGRSKLLSCTAFKDLVETDTIKIKSSMLCHECKNYIRLGGSYRAKKGATDDLISAVLIVIQMLSVIASYDQTAHDLLYAYAHSHDNNEPEWDENDSGEDFIFG